MFDWLKKLFKKKEYAIQLTPELLERIEPIVKKQLAELMAENQKLKEEIEKLKKEVKKEKPEELKVLEGALVQKKKLEIEKRRRRVVWVPFVETPNKTLKPLNIVYVPYGGGEVIGSKGKYKYLVGFEQEEYENGLSSEVHFLVKTHPKAKTFARITPSPSISLPDVFSQPYFVKTLISGVFNSPVDVNGKTVEIIQEKSSLDAQVSQYIESLKQEIARLKEENERLASEKYSVDKKYQELLVENQKLKEELSLASYRADVAQALTIDQTRKVKEMIKDVATVLTPSMDSLLNQMLVERINWVLSEGLKTLRIDLAEAYGKTIEDEVWAKIEKRFRTMFEDITSLLPKEKIKEVKEVKEAKPAGGK